MKKFFKFLFAATLMTSSLMAVCPPFPNIPWSDLQPSQQQRAPNKEIFLEANEEESCDACFANISSWRKYKADFGIEKIYVRFPHTPTISQGDTVLSAYAYDRNVCYSFYGYYPPIGSLHAQTWFDEALAYADAPPFNLICYNIFVDVHGYWVLDYTTHDTYNNVMLKSRSIVTPFNAYTLQCSYPYGYYDRFDYFLTSFRIHCECGY